MLRPIYELTGYLHILRKMPIHVLWPFLNWGVCFLLFNSSSFQPLFWRKYLRLYFPEAQAFVWLINDWWMNFKGYLDRWSREGNGTPLQYSCLENPMDGGAWWAAVHGVTKSRTQLNILTFTLHFHALEKAMATHSSVLAWRIPGTGEPDGLLSTGSHRVGHDWSDIAAAAADRWSVQLWLHVFYTGYVFKWILIGALIGSKLRFSLI